MGNKESKLSKVDKAVQCDMLSTHGPKLELVPYVPPDERMMSLCQTNPKAFADASVDKLFEELQEADINDENFRRAMEYSEEDMPYVDRFRSMVEQLSPTALTFVKERGVAESVKLVMKIVFNECMNGNNKALIWAAIGLGLIVAIFGIAGIFSAPLRSFLVLIFQRLAAIGWLNIFNKMSTILNVGNICKELLQVFTCKDKTKMLQ